MFSGVNNFSYFIGDLHSNSMYFSKIVAGKITRVIYSQVHARAK